jgi:hypothetical protein
MAGRVATSTTNEWRWRAFVDSGTRVVSANTLARQSLDGMHERREFEVSVIGVWRVACGDAA